MKVNEKQEQVINELDKNILLLASAGTGKTDALARRIANIIHSGKAKPSEILCITFTNKAAKEMESRVKSIVKENSKGITIRTFHGFCFDIIKREAKRNTDIFTDFTIFDEDDCKDLINTFRPKVFSSNSIQRFINLVKEESLKCNIDYETSIDKIFKYKEGEVDYICKDDRYINYELKKYFQLQGIDLVNIYNKLLLSNHALDFNDLIINARKILSNKEVVDYLRSKYKYINVDEVQDTSVIEYSIIENVFYNNNVLICGDIFQTIYKWRGSNPEIILKDFSSKYSPLKVVFNKNYRATKALTAASLKYLSNSFSEVSSIYNEGIYCESEEKGNEIIFKEAADIYSEGQFIYNKIKNLKNNGIDISKTCVLTRDNRYNIELSKNLSYLQKSGQDFEFVLVDDFKFFRRMEVKDVLAFLRLIGNKNDSISLKRILKRFSIGVGEKTISEIEGENYKKAGILLADFIDKKTLKGEYFSLLIEEFNSENIVVFDVESTGVDTTNDEIVQIAAIKINSKGEILDRFEKFLIPEKPVGDSEYVHGFSDKYLKENGEESKKVLRDFLKFSNETVIVGHNVQFDINIFESALSRHNLEKPKFKAFYDTLDIYRRFYPNLENHKLETLSKIFETNNTPSHNAMDDILATSDLLVRSINKDIIPTSLERIGLISKHLKAFTKVYTMLNSVFDFAINNRPHDIVAYIIKAFNINELYKTDKASEKIERLRDFYVLLKDLDDLNKSNRDSILDVLKVTSLSNGELENIIIKRSGRIRIPIITVHQAKGLEYENVFIAGLQEGKFPSYMSVKNNELEEEKRTFYVAITRAKKRLYLSYSLDSGKYRPNSRSRFIDILPEEYVVYI